MNAIRNVTFYHPPQQPTNWDFLVENSESRKGPKIFCFLKRKTRIADAINCF